MKPRNFIELVGFKKKPKHYPYEILEYKIANLGAVKYAQWKHPSETKKVLTTDLVEKYKEYIKEGDFCIDIGAHSGDTTLPMALASGKSGCVLALEPNPFVYPVLEKNARLNSNIANIKTIMAAAGPEEGFMEFEYSDPGFCNGGRHENISALKHGHAYKQTVFAINLENELTSDYADLLTNLSFLKVDAEGYDLYILQSLNSTIAKHRPVVKAEIFKKTDLAYREQLLKFFQDQNYTVYKVVSDPVAIGEELNQENLSVGNHFDILAIPK